MENQSQTMTPEESIRLISRFIANYRKNYQHDSFYFLLWGWMITIASLSHFTILRILISTEVYNLIGWFSAINWTFFVVLGIIIQIIHIRRISANNPERSHLDKYITRLWQTTAIVLFLVLFISLKLGVYPTPFILSVVGLATLVTGFIIRFDPLKYGGIALFIFAVIAAFITNEYQLIINAVALSSGYLIPGYMLKYKKQ